jgi:hypothetical protein
MIRQGCLFAEEGPHRKASSMDASFSGASGSPLKERPLVLFFSTGCISATLVPPVSFSPDGSGPITLELASYFECGGIIHNFK